MSTSRETHMKQVTTSAHVRAAGLATAVPMVVMILGRRPHVLIT